MQACISHTHTQPHTHTHTHTNLYASYAHHLSLHTGQKYKLNITNFYKTDSLYNWGLQPLLYSEARAKTGDGVGWHRSGDRICYYQNTLKRQKVRGEREGGRLKSLGGGWDSRWADGSRGHRWLESKLPKAEPNSKSTPPR